MVSPPTWTCRTYAFTRARGNSETPRYTYLATSRRFSVFSSGIFLSFFSDGRSIAESVSTGGRVADHQNIESSAASVKLRAIEEGSERGDEVPESWLVGIHSDGRGYAATGDPAAPAAVVRGQECTLRLRAQQAGPGTGLRSLQAGSSLLGVDQRGLAIETTDQSHPAGDREAFNLNICICVIFTRFINNA